jgi:hypothetical protein
MTINSSPGKQSLHFDVSFNGDGDFKMQSKRSGITMTQATLRQLCSLLGTKNIKIKLNEYK